MERVDDATDRLGKEIDLLSSAEADTRGYLSIPASGNGRGVVVIHEAWGLSDWILDVCDRLSREGFVALAPDLYAGRSTHELDEALELMGAMEIPLVLEIIDDAVATLLGHDAVEGSKLGCLGFCMGGALALGAACRNPRIGATIDCYGVHPMVELDLSALASPVLGIFAESDEYVEAQAVRKLEADLEAAAKRAHFTVHLGVQHAFMNESRPEVFDAPTAAEAWRDLLSFLRAELD